MSNSSCNAWRNLVSNPTTIYVLYLLLRWSIAVLVTLSIAVCLIAFLHDIILSSLCVVGYLVLCGNKNLLPQVVSGCFLEMALLITLAIIGHFGLVLFLLVGIPAFVIKLMLSTDSYQEKFDTLPTRAVWLTDGGTLTGAAGLFFALHILPSFLMAILIVFAAGWYLYPGLCYSDENAKSNLKEYNESVKHVFQGC